MSCETNHKETVDEARIKAFVTAGIRYGTESAEQARARYPDFLRGLENRCGPYRDPPEMKAPECEKPDPALLSAVRRFQKGDGRAFRILYENSFPRVKASLQYILRDEEAAENLAEETMYRVYENVRRLKDPEKYVGWVDRIAMDCAKARLIRIMRQEDGAEDTEKGKGEENNG